MTTPRKSRAKWQRGIPICGLDDLLGYVRYKERYGWLRKDIMVYAWASSTKDGRRYHRPLSITFIFNMPFALVESLCRSGHFHRAIRKDATMRGLRR